MTGVDPTATTVTRARHKQRDDIVELYALLDEVHVAHVGIVREDGTPLVLSTAIARDGDRLLIHGSTGSPWLGRVAGGAPISVAVTTVDGLVLARSAFESSIHYRSAVLFGSCTRLSDVEQKRAALDVLTDALIPGRVGELRPSTARELAATSVLALPIQTWSLKVSDGWPDDPGEDVAGPAWAGVVPARTVYGTPIPAPDLRPGIAVPESARALNVD